MYVYKYIKNRIWAEIINKKRIYGGEIHEYYKELHI